MSSLPSHHQGFNSLGKAEVGGTRRRVLLVDGGRGRTAPLPPGSRQHSQAGPGIHTAGALVGAVLYNS